MMARYKYICKYSIYSYIYNHIFSWPYRWVSIASYKKVEVIMNFYVIQTKIQKKKFDQKYSKTILWKIMTTLNKLFSIVIYFKIF